MATSSHPETLQEAILRLGETRPTDPTTIFEGRDEREILTRGALVDRAYRSAARLAEHDIGPGSPVMLALPTGAGFLETFWGCALLGAAPVPLAPASESMDGQDITRRVEAVAEVTGARVLVTDVEGLQAMERRDTGIACLGEPADDTSADSWEPSRQVTPTDTALIQFTSGSTRSPRGCVISHAALAHNLAQCTRRLEITRPLHGVNWCPLHHDMGLLGSVVLPVWGGQLIAVQQSPKDFLTQPLSWLRLMDKYRAEISAAPNIGFALVVKRLRRGAPDLDLSCMRSIFNGAEPIRASVIRDFCDLLEPCGFPRSAIHPAYGLAEHVVLATSSPGGLRVDRIRRTDLVSLRAIPAASGDEDGVDVACLGTPIDGLEVRILREDSEECGPREVGEVVLRSPSLMAGYLSLDDADGLDKGGWFRTGDLGYLAEGELFIVGRAKDVVIQGGRNIVASDIERALEDSDVCRPGRAIAVGVVGTDSTEHLVVLMEDNASRRSEEELAQREDLIRRTCQGECDVTIRDLVFVPRGELPRTTSGKVRRAEARGRYLRGAWGPLPNWVSSSDAAWAHQEEAVRTLPTRPQPTSPTRTSGCSTEWSS